MRPASVLQLKESPNSRTVRARLDQSACSRVDDLRHHAQLVPGPQETPLNTRSTSPLSARSAQVWSVGGKARRRETSGRQIDPEARQ